MLLVYDLVLHVLCPVCNAVPFDKWARNGRVPFDKWAGFRRHTNGPGPFVHLAHLCFSLVAVWVTNGTRRPAHKRDRPICDPDCSQLIKRDGPICA